MQADPIPITQAEENCRFRLSGQLKVAAESAFHARFDDVEICVGKRARDFGADAFVLGNRIHLSDALSPSPQQLLTLLGHELAHIVQHRQGRVKATRRLHGLPTNDDLALEREAETAGLRFAYNLPQQLAASNRDIAASKGKLAAGKEKLVAGNSPHVLQRSVTVAGRNLSTISSLSQPTRAVLSFIQGGPTWLAWAIQSTNNYSFASERDLAIGVQVGLHNEPTLLLRNAGVRVHPFRLLEMQWDELTLLTQAEANQSPLASMQVKEVLARHHILSQKDIAVAAQLLSQWGVSDAPLFQAMTLSDHIAISGLANHAYTGAAADPSVQIEAANFATAIAQTPKDFVNYFKFYLTLAEGSAPGTPMTRHQHALNWLQAAEPILFGALDGPMASPSSEPMTVPATIHNWIASGHTLGFSRYSLATLQAAQSLVASGNNDPLPTEAIHAYLNRAQHFLTQIPPHSVIGAQDGGEYVLSYESDLATATVIFDATGKVSLGSFVEKPQPPQP